MVAPSIRAVGAPTSGSTGTPTFAEPAGTQPDDVIVCTWFQDDARTDISSTLPTGFGACPDLRQFNAFNGAPNHSLFGFFGRRSAVGAGPYTFTVVPGIGSPTPFCEGFAFAVQDAKTTGSPFDAADGATSGTDNVNDAPLVSAASSGPNRLAVGVATNWTTGAWTPSAGFSEVLESTNKLLTIDQQTLPTATTVSPQPNCSGTGRSNAWVGIFLPIGGATVTGSASVDLGPLDVTATGQVTVLGGATVNLNDLAITAVGQRTAVGVATVNLGALAISGSSITGGPVVLPDDFYSPGPCRPYEWVGFCVPLPIESAAISGYAVQAASEILYYASAQQFDTCQVTIRPCRKSCFGDVWPRLLAGWWEYGGGPVPALINGLWYNIACGTCGTDCSCTIVSETLLPGPVREIAQVTLDGEVLVNGTDYRLDDYRKLVRLGGNQWPLCNDLTKGITESGTWSVTAIYGLPLPTLGKFAMGQLLCQIIADVLGDDCALPDNVTNVTRQGLSFTIDDVATLVQNGFTGLKYVDQFIQRYNPNKLPARPRLYDVDGPGYRVTGTVIS